MHLIYNSAYHP
jgi:hypothetical protein